MTFDHEGVPIVYSQQEVSHSVQELKYYIPKLPKFHIKTSVYTDDERNQD